MEEGGGSSRRARGRRLFQAPGEGLGHGQGDGYIKKKLQEQNREKTEKKQRFRIEMKKTRGEKKEQHLQKVSHEVKSALGCPTNQVRRSRGAWTLRDMGRLTQTAHKCHRNQLTDTSTNLQRTNQPAGKPGAASALRSHLHRTATAKRSTEHEAQRPRQEQSIWAKTGFLSPLQVLAPRM